MMSYVLIKKALLVRLTDRLWKEVARQDIAAAVVAVAAATEVEAAVSYIQNKL